MFDPGNVNPFDSINFDAGQRIIACPNVAKHSRFDGPAPLLNRSIIYLPPCCFMNAAARFASSSDGTSSTCVEKCHWCPKGSSRLPDRSP